MTQEEKQLLLVDLCARLPYKVIVEIKSYGQETQKPWFGELSCKDLECFLQDVAYRSIKPYLRPMSSMTEEEKKEFIDAVTWEANSKFYIDECEDITFYQEKYDWLNAHHFDYRGLIEKCLAISTEEFNPYKD